MFSGQSYEGFSIYTRFHPSQALGLLEKEAARNFKTLCTLGPSEMAWGPSYEGFTGYNLLAQPSQVSGPSKKM